MDRRELTQNIVNNLKQKFTAFRGRKKKNKWKEEMN